MYVSECVCVCMLVWVSRFVVQGVRLGDSGLGLGLEKYVYWFGFQGFCFRV